MVSFDDLIQELVKSHGLSMIFSQIFLKKYIELGYISEEDALSAFESILAQLDELEASDGILNVLKDGTLSISLDESIVAPCYADQDINEVMTISVNDLEQGQEQFTEILPKVIDSMIKGATAELSDQWKNATTQELSRIKAERTDFADTVYASWGKALDALEVLIDLCVHLGNTFYAEYSAQARTEGNIKFEALSRIHARSSKVASEIHTLLSSGFADGANARWRTLHELAVIAGFLAKYGNDASERYLLHSQVEEYQLMKDFQQSAKKQGWPLIPQHKIAAAKKQVDSLKVKYGKAFGADYGWASHEIGKQHVKFVDIQTVAERDEFKPPYKMSHKYVHASSYGTIFPLGADPYHDYLIAGGSIFGLYEPGRQTTQAICLVTGILLRTLNSIEDFVSIGALIQMRDEVWKQFDAAETQVTKSVKRGKIRKIRPLILDKSQ